MKKILNMLIRLIFWTVAILAFVFGIPKLITALASSGKIHTVAEAPDGYRAAIVFGAGLQKDGTPSPVLKDRVETAVKLYTAGKVEKILMSGDNRFIDYNEPQAMKEYAISLGAPEEVIVLDYAGRRTYDTCYRAHVIFGLQKALLVTQKYHLPRAIFSCNGLGMETSGVVADVRNYSQHSVRYWKLRELPATLVALWQVWISKPLPVLGEPEPIFQVNENEL
ncbi:MAG: ElyC/SanA/YdcF family protein [Anaerolineaceae bacterium]|nr:YdcF family protein [Anaerolineaceae bacterium]